MAFDGTVISSIVDECNEKLAGGRIDKIYQPEKDELIVSVRNNKVTYKLLITVQSTISRLHLTQVPKKNPQTPPSFCMLLRKYIGSGKIIGIVQPNFERIVEISIEHLNELGDLCVKKLIVEIMGKHSNIILCDDQNKIIDSIKHISAQVSSVREVLPGRDYVYPPSKNKVDPLLTYSIEAFTQLLKEKRTIIHKCLYFSFNGISPILAEELCYRTGINSSQSVDTLTSEDFTSLFEAFNQMMKRIKEKKATPTIIVDEKGYLEFSSIPLQLFKDKKQLVFSSISEAVDQYYKEKANSSRIKQKSSDIKRLITVNLERCYKKLDIQLKQLRDTENRENYKIKGELIHANLYQLSEGDTTLETMNYYTQKPIKIALDPTLSPAKNAQKFYNRYNKLKRTNEAVKVHIEETKKEIEHLESIQNALDFSETEEDIMLIRTELMTYGYLRARGRNKNKKALGKSQLIHYKSSQGYDIYIGKNNMQNDELTMKLASSQDWWFHTKEVPGSHVILKSNGDELPDNAFVEAARLAAFYSKASQSSKVAVDYTLRKNLKKPNGAKPGFVIYHTNYSMYVNPNDQNLERQEE